MTSIVIQVIENNHGKITLEIAGEGNATKLESEFSEFCIEAFYAAAHNFGETRGWGNPQGWLAAKETI